MLELVNATQNCDATGLRNVRGIAFKNERKTLVTRPRGFSEDLDSLPFPSRELFDNQAYKDYYSRKFGYTTTSVITA